MIKNCLLAVTLVFMCCATADARDCATCRGATVVAEGQRTVRPIQRVRQKIQDRRAARKERRQSRRSH